MPTPNTVQHPSVTVTVEFTFNTYDLPGSPKYLVMGLNDAFREWVFRYTEEFIHGDADVPEDHEITHIEINFPDDPTHTELQLQELNENQRMVDHIKEQNGLDTIPLLHPIE